MKQLNNKEIQGLLSDDDFNAGLRKATTKAIDMSTMPLPFIPFMVIQLLEVREDKRTLHYGMALLPEIPFNDPKVFDYMYSAGVQMAREGIKHSAAIVSAFMVSEGRAIVAKHKKELNEKEQQEWVEKNVKNPIDIANDPRSIRAVSIIGSTFDGRTNMCILQDERANDAGDMQLAVIEYEKYNPKRKAQDNLKSGYIGAFWKAVGEANEEATKGTKLSRDVIVNVTDLRKRGKK
jgi:hypothetical protein